MIRLYVLAHSTDSACKADGHTTARHQTPHTTNFPFPGHSTDHHQFAATLITTACTSKAQGWPSTRRREPTPSITDASKSNKRQASSPQPRHLDLSASSHRLRMTFRMHKGTIRRTVKQTWPKVGLLLCPRCPMSEHDAVSTDRKGGFATLYGEGIDGNLYLPNATVHLLLLLLAHHQGSLWYTV